MTETEFLQQIKILFDSLEDEVEQKYPDFDVLRHGALLEIESDKGQKVIINKQTPMSEVWLASRQGAYHFIWDGVNWVNTRDGLTFAHYLNIALDDLSQ